MVATSHLKTSVGVMTCTGMLSARDDTTMETLAALAATELTHSQLKHATGLTKGKSHGAPTVS